MNSGKIIFDKLNYQLKEAKTKFDETNIFGIFSSDNCEHIYILIIPTFEDIVLSEPLIEEVHDNIYYLDVRFMYHSIARGYPQLIEALYTDFYLVNPRYENIFLKLFKANREKIDRGRQTGDSAPELKTALHKLMRAAMNDNSNTVKFYISLTDVEKIALEGLISLIGDEGYVSQAKLASSLGVARSTVTRLILKMELHNVAIVHRDGIKGTYIKIIDYGILNVKPLGGNL